MYSYCSFKIVCTSKASWDASSNKVHACATCVTLSKPHALFNTFKLSFSTESELYKDVAVLPNEQDLVREEAQKMSSLLPTMWLGTQNGW